MKYAILLIFIPPLLIGCAGAEFTWTKLDRMKRIRGFKPGATVETHTVHDKHLQPPNTYWVSWTDQNIRGRGNHRLNLPETVWNNYQIGDEIEIVFLPNENSPYHRDGHFASDGNFAFDYGLLAIEIGMIVFVLLGATATLWFLNRFGQKPGSEK